MKKEETHVERCVWLLSVSYVCLLCKAHQKYMVILQTLRDCSIMCAMLLCFAPSKNAIAISVMETITNP